MRRKPKHACADYLYERRGYHVNDTIVCPCGRRFTLRPLTRGLVLAFWRPIESHDSDEQAWVRNRKAERAARRERIVREREWRRNYG